MLENYQKEFINFLLSSSALQFGEFKLKSGRLAPYFINSASFNDGKLINQLGKFYASHILNAKLGQIDNIFGPAYKGIPLAVATSSALYSDHNIVCGYSFDRKEIKTHGDGGKIVGKKLSSGMRLVIVEDVVTAGTTLSEVIPTLREMENVDIAAVILSVDRQEKGTGETSAVNELQSSLKVKILPIVTISQIINYLSSEEAGNFKLKPDILDSINSYRSQYAA